MTAHHSVDQLCQQFEAAWQGEDPPAIAEYISRVNAGDVDSLLTQLVSLDVKCRLAAGRTVDAGAYQQFGTSAVAQAEECLTESTATESRDADTRASAPQPDPHADMQETVLQPPNADSTDSHNATQTGDSRQAADTPTISSATEDGSRVFGQYTLQQQIGSGGMGVVFRAVHNQLGRTVALKLIRNADLAGNEETIRFEREAQAAAKLSHKNIVTVFEFSHAGAVPYFSMELVEGSSLADVLREHGPLSVHDASRLVHEIATAVGYAHDNGIIHRDLKPANILLDEHHVPKVADFGLARAEQDGEQLTATGAIVGTPSYMAPEQAAGRTREVGKCSDIYALGAILYECLTGVPPFRAENAQLTLMQVIENSVVAPRERQPDVPRDADSVCMKCLAKLPEQRYANAHELVADLDRLMKEQPVMARSRTTRERLQNWLRDHVAIVAVAAALVVTLPSFLLSPFLTADAGLDLERSARRSAIGFLTSLIEANPQDAIALVRRAENRLAINEFSAAREDAEAALALGYPRPATLHSILGQCALAQDEFDDAETQFLLAVQLDSDDTDSWLGLGRTRLKAGNLQAAIDALSEVISMLPDDPEPRRLRAEAYDSAGRASLAEQDRVVIERLSAKPAAN